MTSFTVASVERCFRHRHGCEHGHMMLVMKAVYDRLRRMVVMSGY